MNFKKFGMAEMAMTKAAVFFGTLFLVSVYGPFAAWVAGVHWAWFLAVAIALSIKPMMVSLKK